MARLTRPGNERFRLAGRRSWCGDQKSAKLRRCYNTGCIIPKRGRNPIRVKRRPVLRHTWLDTLTKTSIHNLCPVFRKVPDRAADHGNLYLRHADEDMPTEEKRPAVGFRMRSIEQKKRFVLNLLA